MFISCKDTQYVKFFIPTDFATKFQKNILKPIVYLCPTCILCITIWWQKSLVRIFLPLSSLWQHFGSPRSSFLFVRFLDLDNQCENNVFDNYRVDNHHNQEYRNDNTHAASSSIWSVLACTHSITLASLSRKLNLIMHYGHKIITIITIMSSVHYQHGYDYQITIFFAMKTWLWCIETNGPITPTSNNAAAVLRKYNLVMMMLFMKIMMMKIMKINCSS